MGLDSIITNNPDWDNNISKSMKQINEALERDFKNEKKK